MIIMFRFLTLKFRGKPSILTIRVGKIFPKEWSLKEIFDSYISIRDLGDY